MDSTKTIGLILAFAAEYLSFLLPKWLQSSRSSSELDETHLNKVGLELAWMDPLILSTTRARDGLYHLHSDGSAPSSGAKTNLAISPFCTEAVAMFTEIQAKNGKAVDASMWRLILDV